MRGQKFEEWPRTVLQNCCAVDTIDDTFGKIFLLKVKIKGTNILVKGINFCAERGGSNSKCNL